MRASYRKMELIRALDDMVQREDGLTFQRLARRLLRETVSTLIPHAEHNDLGRDATIEWRGGSTIVLTSLDARLDKIRADIKRALGTGASARQAIFCTPRA